MGVSLGSSALLGEPQVQSSKEIMDDLKDYRYIADEARDQCENAKAQSRRHSCDLKQMRRVAAEAKDLLQQGQARQRKRENTRLTEAA